MLQRRLFLLQHSLILLPHTSRSPAEKAWRRAHTYPELLATPATNRLATGPEQTTAACACTAGHSCHCSLMSRDDWHRSKLCRSVSATLPSRSGSNAERPQAV